MTDFLLPRSGTLVAWTTQGFPPGAPYAGPTGDDFVPFGVGLVQLGDVIRVEGRLTETIRPSWTSASRSSSPWCRSPPTLTATRSSRSRSSRLHEEPEMTNDVAIIGVGLHPFGRFDKTAMQMGAEAIQFALADAGVSGKTSNSASAAATRCPTPTR